MAEQENTPNRFRRYPELALLKREPNESTADWQKRLDRERKRLKRGDNVPLGAPKKNPGGKRHGDTTPEESAALAQQPGEDYAEWRRRYAREIMRRWRAKAHNKAKADSRRREIYRLSGDSETRKAWKAANKERMREWHRAYDKANLPKKLAALAAWQAANPEQMKAVRRKYVQDHPEIFLAAQARYRARAMEATPAWADWKQIEAFYNLARKLTRQTGIEHHVDHIVPLNGKTVCGLHVHYNLRVITKAENLKKRNRLDLSLLEAA